MIINWNIVNIESDILEGVIEVNKSRDWMVYVLHKAASAVNKAAVGGLRDLMPPYTQLHWFKTNVQVKASEQNNTNAQTMTNAQTVPNVQNMTSIQINTFTSPYNVWFFTPEGIQTIVWTINVHSAFSINLTIWKAYVPYSKRCVNGMIALSDIHSKNTNVTNIWWGCGHVINDNSYSKCNKAHLEFSLKTDMLPFPAGIHTSYQVMQLGAAYVFSRTFVPQGWVVPVLPNIVFFYKGQLLYIWYISNQVNMTEASMEITHINITSFACSLRGSLLVFPGWLTLYQMMWLDKPLYTIQCDKHAAMATIKLTFHVHATLVVHTHGQDLNTILLFTFSSSKLLPYQLKPRAQVSLITDQSLPYSDANGESQMSFLKLPRHQALSLEFIFFVAEATYTKLNIKESHFQLLPKSVQGKELLFLK